VPDRNRFAARTEHASWRSIGVFTNPLLLWGVAFEIAVVTLPPPQSPFHTAVPDPSALALLIPFPFIIWGADELPRYAVQARHRITRPPQMASP
jgi:hypothetical protein